MALLAKCPACGLDSAELRCPRCNALKVVGCSGSCSACGTSSTCKTAPVDVLARPTDEARADEEHPGTPLER